MKLAFKDSSTFQEILANLCSCPELNEKIDTTLMYVNMKLELGVD